MQRRPRPSFAPQRQRSILRPDRPGFLLKHFHKPFWAFIWSFVLLVIAGLVYFIIHLIVPATTFEPRKAIQFELGASLRPIYNLAILERFCSKPSIAQISERIEQKRKVLSNVLIRQRRVFMAPVMSLNQSAIISDDSPPAILGMPPEKATDEEAETADEAR